MYTTVTVLSIRLNRIGCTKCIQTFFFFYFMWIVLFLIVTCTRFFFFLFFFLFIEVTVSKFYFLKIALPSLVRIIWANSTKKDQDTASTFYRSLY